MKKFFKYLLYFIGFIFLLGIIAYFLWFHNPHEHSLVLDPVSVFAERSAHDGYLITNANIVDVETGSIIEKQHLLIVDDRIDYISGGELPDSLIQLYTLIDVNDQYILPGLFDMHVHINSGGILPPDESIRKSALEQFLRYGVSAIFTLGEHGFNEEVSLDLRNKQRNKEIIGPDMYLTGDFLTTTGGYPLILMAMMLGKSVEEIDLDENGLIEFTENTDLDYLFSKKKEKGVNGIKIMLESNLGGNNPLPRLSNDLVKKATETAAQFDLPVFVHVLRQTDLIDAVESGVNVIAHTAGDVVMENDIAIFEKMRDDSIWYTPTLSIAWMFQYTKDPVILKDPFLMENSSRRTTRSLENWPIRQLIMSEWGDEPFTYVENMYSNFQLMHRAGVPIMLGTDAGNLAVVPGYSAHLELEFMTHAGMSNIEALRSATIVPAKFLGKEEEVGTISEGKLANFLVLKENPLNDIRNTRSLQRVMHRGTWIE
ncbi:MAG: hypothetical protein EA362_05010 [Saprospirales bacterium]|nr:MAG: hypothetical protein EA362_05010 [Saprospirales bacterium]